LKNIWIQNHEGDSPPPAFYASFRKSSSKATFWWGKLFLRINHKMSHKILKIPFYVQILSKGEPVTPLFPSGIIKSQL